MSYDFYLFRPASVDDDADQLCVEIFTNNVQPKAPPTWETDCERILKECMSIDPNLDIERCQFEMGTGFEISEPETDLQIHLWADGTASASIPYIEGFSSRMAKLCQFLLMFEKQGFKIYDPQLGTTVSAQEISESDSSGDDSGDFNLFKEKNFSCTYDPEKLFAGFAGILEENGWALEEKAETFLKGVRTVETPTGKVVYSALLKRPYAFGNVKDQLLVNVSVKVEQADGSGKYTCGRMCADLSRSIKRICNSK